MECGTTVGAETGFFAIRAPTDARSDLGLRSVITQNPRIPQASGYNTGVPYGIRTRVTNVKG